jgi:hypothetical protein
MARTTLSSGIEIIRGQVGGFVYRWVRGKQVVSAAPEPSSVPRTAKQKAQSQRLALASKRAKAALKDPQKKAAYRKLAKKLGKPLMSVATRDCMRHGPV